MPTCNDRRHLRNPPIAAQNTSTPAMTLLVDETQAFRQIAFVHESIHVRPGT
jgi:hypothetical protein